MNKIKHELTYLDNTKHNSKIYSQDIIHQTDTPLAGKPLQVKTQGIDKPKRPRDTA